MSQTTGLGDLYKMWEDGNLRKLAQTMTRALDGQVRDDWLEIMSDQNDWDNNDEKVEFIGLLKQLRTKAFGPKAYKQQCNVTESSKIKIPYSNLRKGTERLVQINKLLPYLGIHAHKYTIEQLNKIITKSLTPKAM
jgi:hypothetical protein